VPGHVFSQVHYNFLERSIGLKSWLKIRAQNYSTQYQKDGNADAVRNNPNL
jgi:hypothetical protein